KNVKREVYKLPPMEELPPTDPPILPTEPDDNLTDCYSHCLEKLPENERELLLGYYEGDGIERIKRREKHAGIEENNDEKERSRKGARLRKEIERLRNKLRECTEKCLKGKR